MSASMRSFEIWVNFVPVTVMLRSVSLWFRTTMPLFSGSGVQNDSVGRQRVIAGNGDAAEGEAARADAVRDVDRRACGRGEAVNDRGVILRRADRAAAGRGERCIHASACVNAAGEVDGR